MPVHRSINRSARPLLAAAVAAVLAVGCAWSGGGARVGGGPVYPRSMPQAGDADIHVFRNGTQVSFTNSTPATYNASRIWFNRQYALEIGRVEIGQTVTMDLSNARNEFGERFRAGGFFATVDPARLVKAELETPKGLIGLAVIDGRGE